MYSFKTNDVNDALYHGITHLLQCGVEEQSRNGRVLVAPEPVCTEYINPRSRVLYSPTRDANPFFHFFEALWILSGSNDVEFTSYFAKNMLNYSDDGKTSWGAYGWRLRSFFGYDQILAVVNELRNNPQSRRCVLSMWSPDGGGTPAWQNDFGITHSDLSVATNGGKDVPCNTQIYVDARGGRLNITVTNRSNDILWGCYGANAVHFSFLQEYLAMRVGIPVGVYRQFSNNFHCYTSTFSYKKLEQIAHESDTLGRLPKPGPSIEPGFDADLNLFMPWARAVMRSGPEDTIASYAPTLQTPFMAEVAQPMFLTWVYHKWHDELLSGECLENIAAPDWHRACSEWIERRKK